MYYKYPKTLHLPWSLGISRDDKILKSIDHFNHKRIIITEKMDGENGTVYQDYYHARSLDGRSHPSRDYIKQEISKFQYKIPNGWRICFENLYATHTIHYTNLKSYIQAFSIWDDKNVCTSWDEFILWMNEFEINTVRVLYDGIWDASIFEELDVDLTKSEGYVIRCAEEFKYDDFERNVAKFVRKNHVQTNDHWMYNEIVPNELEKRSE